MEWIKEWIKVSLFLCSIHRTYSKENMSFPTSKATEQFSKTTSLRVSNVLRDVLNQESLVRLSMVQKIQNLAMDSIEHQSKEELLMNNHRSLTLEMKSLKTKYEQQEERIAALEDQNVKLNEHVHQLLQHQGGERNRSLLLKQDAIEIDAFQALWNNINETFTLMKKVEDILNNVSYALNKTGNKRMIYFTAGTIKFTYWKEGEIIIFPHVISNGGGGYNASNGIFTAPRSGVYIFTLFLAISSGREITGTLVVNGSPKVGTYLRRRGGTTASVGNSAVFPLVQGDRVWVENTSGSDLWTQSYAPVSTFNASWIVCDYFSSILMLQ